MTTNWVVTIDGPAASGKSSVSRELSKRLGCRWLSTGSFYRGLALVAQKLNVDINDEQSLAALANSPEWSVVMGAENTHIFFQGQDVTHDSRDESVGAWASKVSQYPLVRATLLSAQRACVKGTTGLVAEGRDCGSVVFPEAIVKIYLTARSESRAARRAAEQGANLQEIKEAQKVRDAQDKGRKTAPLQIPERAHVVDASDLTLDQVVDQVYKIVKNALETNR